MDQNLPAHIELQTGPDNWYHGAVVLLWLLAGGSLINILPLLPWSLLLACVSLLALLPPGSRRCMSVSGPLLLYRSGAAQLGPQRGTWSHAVRTSRWVTLVRVQTPAGARNVLVCASRNRAPDYRRLLVWSRFPPMGWPARAGAGGQRGAQAW